MKEKREGREGGERRRRSREEGEGEGEGGRRRRRKKGKRREDTLDIWASKVSINEHQELPTKM